jgi:hypothetical protein
MYNIGHGEYFAFGIMKRFWSTKRRRKKYIQLKKKEGVYMQ